MTVTPLERFRRRAKRTIIKSEKDLPVTTHTGITIAKALDREE